MYAAHFADVERHFRLSDIHQLPADRIPTVTLATASFPCTDLSLAGARGGLSGKQSSAFWGFVSVSAPLGVVGVRHWRTAMMPTFTITAYQEMYTERVIEAENAREAVAKFRERIEQGLLEGDKADWEKSDEDLDIAFVRDEDDQELQIEEWE
jgi:hypothetical protein